MKPKEAFGTKAMSAGKAKTSPKSVFVAPSRFGEGLSRFLAADLIG
ncbi:MAG: hypothetical protein LBO72_10045 [Helicobacteraceae bacterium]|jgi:hypothetical protein|nr:hypothetical protein [Helicobacteraceae bacterium]